MQLKNSSLSSPLPTIREEPEEGNKSNVIKSFPDGPPFSKVDVFSKPFGTGMIRGVGNKLNVITRIPPPNISNNNVFGMNKNYGGENISIGSFGMPRRRQDTPKGSQKGTFRKRNDESLDGYNPIDRPCSVIFEEDKKNAEYYSHLDEIDDNIIISGLNDIPSCYEKWEDANFHPTLLNTIIKSGYTKPRKIQSYAMPIIMKGLDLIGQSETGSGKTGAYLLPILDDMLKRNWKGERRVPFALIVAPTRELVLQIHEQARKFSEGSNYNCAKLYGQISYAYLQRELDRGCDILVATPGRLSDFLSKAQIHLHKLHYVVCDEADRLMEYNFANEVNNILKSPLCTPMLMRHNLLFSATFPSELEKYCREWVKENAVTIKNDKIEGFNKNKMVVDILVDEQKEAQNSGMSLRKTLVFVDRKKTSDMLAFLLINNNIKASSLNGDRCQEDREKALNAFRSGFIDVLVATDVAARGIDICGLDHVIVVELPSDFMTFIHRVGRTGRIKGGEATTFYDPKKDYVIAKELSNMLQKAGQEIPDFLRQV